VLDRAPRDSVGDSGIWQHMQSPSLPLADLATLIGATSDNLATNVLLRYVGLEAVRARTETLGLTRTALLDLVRDHRGPDDAPQLSIGSAKELTWLFASLARGEIVSPEVSQRVVGWLSLNSDLSMVASAFGLDPLAHRMPDHGVLLMNKTGTDGGVRSEVACSAARARASPTRCRCTSPTRLLTSRLACSTACTRSGSTCWNTCTSDAAGSRHPPRR
jgi:beta-lactamase class A